MLVNDMVTGLSQRESVILIWYRRNPVMARYTLGVLLIIPFILVTISVDQRMLNGINIWIKPLKFNIAAVLYLGTLTWYCGWINPSHIRHTAFRFYVHILCGTLLFMLPWLYAAAIIGEPAHYNRTHPILAPVYSVMGVISVVFTTGALVVGVLIAKNKYSPLAPYFRHAVIFSLYISFIFTVVMAGELASLDSHWIGGSPTDKDGLWLLGWSRDGGDLRVAHFFSLHAMHFIPLIALTILPAVFARRPIQSAAFVSLSYCAFLLFVYLQARKGLPFIPWIS